MQTLRARWLALRGRDYADLGRFGVAALDDGGAIALSRGAREKPYRYVDPNEDGALILRAGSVALLAVVDGHGGIRASECALEMARNCAPELLAASATSFREGVAALLRGVGTALPRGERSRSCLLLARVSTEHCRWASFGDCTLFRGSQRAPVNRENDLVLGPVLRDPRPAPERWYGVFEPRAGERIALTSDGVPVFVPDPDGIRRVLETSPDDASAATRLARAALEGGASDNVAVATIGT